MSLISSVEKSTSKSDLFLTEGKNDRNVLPLSINEHCFAKDGKIQRVKDFTVFFKVSDKFVIVKSGGMQGIFYHSKESLIEFNIVWD